MSNAAVGWDFSMRLSRPMRLAINALFDGRTCEPGDRPKGVTDKTMGAVERRGLAERDGLLRWRLTDAGRKYAD